MKRPQRRPLPGGERQTRYARLLGLAFCMAGFTALALGWAGAARKACVDCQIPYLISGGAAGVALVVFGAGLLLMAQIRIEARRLSARLEHMTGTLTKSAVDVTAGSANGKVVAGRSTFHLPDCRLVKDKPGLDLVTVEAARQNGLEPCRVCDPLHESRVERDSVVGEPLQSERSAMVGADPRTEKIDAPRDLSHEPDGGTAGTGQPGMGQVGSEQAGSGKPGDEPRKWWERS